MAKLFFMSDIILKEESYKIIGICMEVHRILGRGFLEIVYKDAIQYELRKQLIPHEREKQYAIPYKEIILPHSFFADFIVYDQIILEVKGCSGLTDEFTKLALNYLAVSKCKLALLVNFGRDSLEYKRVVL